MLTPLTAATTGASSTHDLARSCRLPSTSLSVSSSDASGALAEEEAARTTRNMATASSHRRDGERMAARRQRYRGVRPPVRALSWRVPRRSASRQHSETPTMSSPMSIEITVPNDQCVNHLIGPKGSKINELQAKSESSISVQPSHEVPAGCTFRKVKITAYTEENCKFAATLIYARVEEYVNGRLSGVNTAARSALPDQVFEARKHVSAASTVEQLVIEIPNGPLVNFVIGQGGTSVKAIQDSTGCHLEVEKGQHVAPGCPVRKIAISGADAPWRAYAHQLVLARVAEYSHGRGSANPATAAPRRPHAAAVPPAPAPALVLQHGGAWPPPQPQPQPQQQQQQAAPQPHAYPAPQPYAPPQPYQQNAVAWSPPHPAAGPPPPTAYPQQYQAPQQHYDPYQQHQPPPYDPYQHQPPQYHQYGGGHYGAPPPPHSYALPPPPQPYPHHSAAPPPPPPHHHPSAWPPSPPPPPAALSMSMSMQPPPQHHQQYAATSAAPPDGGRALVHIPNDGTVNFVIGQRGAAINALQSEVCRMPHALPRMPCRMLSLPHALLAVCFCFGVAARPIHWPGQQITSKACRALASAQTATRSQPATRSHAHARTRRMQPGHSLASASTSKPPTRSRRARACARWPFPAATRRCASAAPRA